MENTLGIGQAAKLLGIAVKTLQRWQREGRLLPAARTASNRRRYTESQLRAFLRLPLSATPRRAVAYCRASSAAQRPDLANQRRVLEQFALARALAAIEHVEEVGGGLNFGRKRFQALMDAIGRYEVATLMLAHRDCLTRFGCDWFEHDAALESDHAAGAPDQA